MTKRSRRRFEDLIEVVRRVKPAEFSMRMWRCGTTGCAAGHYATAYPRRSLKVDDNMVYTADTTSCAAVAEHFEIPYADAYELFSYVGIQPYFGAKAKRQVIARFRKYLKDQDKEAARGKARA